jgi:hypothetical protein
MMIVAPMILMAMRMILTPSCGSCEFVANIPALSYLQLGHLGTFNSVPSEVLLNKKSFEAEKQLLVF